MKLKILLTVFFLSSFFPSVTLAEYILEPIVTGFFDNAMVAGKVDIPCTSSGQIVFTDKSEPKFLDGSVYVWTWTKNQCVYVPPPDYCHNNLKDATETGIDCGGSCSATCVSKCPSGTVFRTYTGAEGTSVAGQVFNGCVFVTNPDSFGNCPQGYLSFGAGACSTCDGTPECASAYSEPEYLANEDVPLKEPSSTAPPGFETGSLSIVESTSSSTDTVDPSAPAGAQSQVTTTKTTTNSDGTVTTTNITNYYSGTGGTGTIVGTKTVEEVPLEENLENYDFSLGNVEGNTYDTTIEVPVENDIIGLVNDFISQSPLIAMFDTFEIRTSNAVCSVSAGVFYGKEIIIDFCRWQSYIQTLGVMLLALTNGYSLLVIWRGFK